jgi:hypothetical protein
VRVPWIRAGAAVGVYELCAFDLWRVGDGAPGPVRVVRVHAVEPRVAARPRRRAQLAPRTSSSASSRLHRPHPDRERLHTRSHRVHHERRRAAAGALQRQQILRAGWFVTQLCWVVLGPPGAVWVSRALSPLHVLGPPGAVWVSSALSPLHVLGPPGAVWVNSALSPLHVLGPPGAVWVNSALSPLHVLGPPGAVWVNSALSPRWWSGVAVRRRHGARLARRPPRVAAAAAPGRTPAAPRHRPRHSNPPPPGQPVRRKPYPCWRRRQLGFSWWSRTLV